MLARWSATFCELADNPYFADLKKQLPGLKKDAGYVKWSGELLDLASVYSTVLQDVYTSRLKKAMDRFIQGDKNGKRSGRPRFKSQADYRSFKFPQADTNWIDTENHVPTLTVHWRGSDSATPSIAQRASQEPKEGNPPESAVSPDGFTLKTVQIIKKSDGWYANLCVEDTTVPVFKPDEVIPTWGKIMGLDAVLHGDDYFATSVGEKLPSVKGYRKAETKLNKVKSRRSKAKRGSKSRRRLALRAAKSEQRIARARKDHAYKIAHRLVRTEKKVFFHEDLDLKNLTKRNKAKIDETGKFLPNGQSAKAGLNKSWQDAAFGQAFQILEYIAKPARSGGKPAPRRLARESTGRGLLLSILLIPPNYWHIGMNLCSPIVQSASIGMM